MRIVIATGLFPPDVGGPASHAADLAAELRRSGHEVTVITLRDETRNPPEAGVVAFRRRAPWPIRSAAGVWWLVRNRRRYDVVYAAGLPLVAVAGARLAGRPVALKVVGDLAWERAYQAGLTALGFGEFQAQRDVGARAQAYRWVRNFLVRRATVVLTPSDSLRRWIRPWAPAQDVIVVANGVRLPPGLPSPSAAGSTGLPLRLVFAGRLVALKRVDTVLEALARVPDVTLEVVGDGPERAALEHLAGALGVSGRVEFSGALSHSVTLSRLAAADALVLASLHEGMPHAAIEALACGTPVLAAAAEGLLEVVDDGINALVVEPITPHNLAAAMSRLRDDLQLRHSLAEGASHSAERWRFERTAGSVAKLLETIVGGKPRVVFVGKSQMYDPPTPTVRARYELHARYLDPVTVCTGPPGRRRIAGTRVVSLPALQPRLLGGLVFYACGPVLALAYALRRRPSAIVCQSPYEAFGVLVASRLLPSSIRPPVQVELHGDWRTGPRLYGSRARRVLAPVTDVVSAWALRRASRVRAVSGSTEALARAAGYHGKVERYLTFSDYGEFLRRPVAPMPERPQALFAGVLERYKAIDVLLDAWEAVHARVPDATLVMVGTGSMAGWLDRRRREPSLGGTIKTLEPVPQAKLVELLDASTCLVLPSRSEGLPRVAVEAMARGRAVVAADTGGLGEIVLDRATGRLVPSEDVLALSSALVELLSDRPAAAALGAAGRRLIEERGPAREYEDGVRRLAQWVAG